MNVFGVDIGGSGIKGAPVDLEYGELAQERHKVLTPHPSKPEAVVAGVKEVVRHFGWSGPVGVTFPGVVVDGVTRTAANMDQRWVGLDAQRLLADTLGMPVIVRNDADAAGIAEMTFGAGKGHDGTVILLTFGTGIGSAVFVGGHLLPNTELGHLELGGHEAEKRASSKAKEDHGLSWEHWAERVGEYLAHLEMLFSPELFVIGGGVSRKSEKFLPLIEARRRSRLKQHSRAQIVPAVLKNNAGIVGAAMGASAAHAPSVPSVPWSAGAYRREGR